MKNLYRRGLGGLLTWIFIGITALYVAFIFGKHLVVVNGGYSEWSDFTSCSATCGGGTSSRTRSCTNPIPKYGGQNCSNLGPAIETQACNINPCPVDGKYGAWGKFGDCSVTCGGGTQSHERKCDNPAPKYGGKDCTAEGPDKETKPCNQNPCPVNGAYSDWSQWSSCSVTCGEGKKTRTRTCTSPTPAHGGKTCTEQNLGNKEETADCTEKPCVVSSIMSSMQQNSSQNQVQA